MNGLSASNEPCAEPSERPTDADRSNARAVQSASPYDDLVCGRAVAPRLGRLTADAQPGPRPLFGRLVIPEAVRSQHIVHR